MPHMRKINKLIFMIFVFLVADWLTFARTSSNHHTIANDSRTGQEISEKSLSEPNPSESIRQEWPLTENQDPQENLPEDSIPVLNEIVNRLLEGIRPSLSGHESQQNESKHPPKRDLSNHNLSASETDALVYDDHHDGPDRYIQYDTMRLTGGEPAQKYELNEEKSQQLSRYMMGNSTIDESCPSDAISSAQETQPLQQRNSAVQGRAITGLPKISHHSKPPYATGDQFANHRVGSSLAEIPNELPLINTRKGTTAVIAELIPVNNDTDNNNGTEITPASKRRPQTNSTSQEATADLLNSIKRISTNLVDDDRKDTLVSSKKPQEVENLLEKQEFHKLAPANTLIELNPINFDEHSLLGDQLSAPKEPSNEWEGDNSMRMYAFFPGVTASNSHNSDPPTTLANSLQYSSDDQLLSSRFSMDRPTIAESQLNLESNHSIAANSRLSNNHLTKKTVEEVSNQLRQQHQHQHQPQERYQAWANSYEPSSVNITNMTNNNNMHQAGPSTHYAASLTNVTAPLVPPHSATEAMENQAGRGILNQVSGFLRQANHSLLHQQQQRASQTQPRNPASDDTNSQSIYLPPANSFAAQKPPPRPAHESLSILMSQNEPVITMPTNGSIDRRLDNSGHTRRPNSTSQQQQLPSRPASGFRSPAGVGIQQAPSSGNYWHSPYLSSYLNMPLAAGSGQGNAHLTASSSTNNSDTLAPPPVLQNTTSSSSPSPAQSSSSSFSSAPTTVSLSSTTNGFITNGASEQAPMQQQQQISSSTTHSYTVTTPPSSTSTFASATSLSPPSSTEPIGSNASQTAVGLNRRVFNLTRVEHISAECSNDLIRTIIVFNGTFRGMIYSSGYVRDSSCIYVNGTGKTRYDFSIRLNQCGTLTRQELHPAGKDNDVRRRDQVMWNTLSIQYNPIIEQEWDEHFRVSCEYGSDFWKTVSFNPFNVETNTGSPVVFTVDPPQCQMEILRGHGMVGPRQETISGPVTVGDPLTLLIHMKSERAGYDILVKNCIAHDNVKQRMQLIDSNGCVVNERFISPFRGTYNDNDLKHVTLYAYLKAFRFTGSPILYLECEIHMCQSSCPPQMCYWRRLSKRSALSSNGTQPMQYLADDLMEDEPTNEGAEAVSSFNAHNRQEPNRTRKGRKMNESHRNEKQPSLTDKMSLTQSLLVRPLDDPDAAAYSMQQQQLSTDQLDKNLTPGNLLCYRRAEVLAFLLATGSLLFVAMSITIACCWQQTRKLKQIRRTNLAEVANRGFCGASSSLTSLSSANSTSSASSVYASNLNHSLVDAGQVRSNRRPLSGSPSIRQPLAGGHKERLLFLSLLQTHVI